MRVIAALSGGVDSAVAAARCVDAGHEVVGIHLALARSGPGRSGSAGSRGCCTPEDARDARRVADILGIPFYVWDLSADFHRDVIDDFIASYDQGLTPNPCMRCNESIKFAAVLERARALGYDAVATGHYARIVDGPEGRELHRSVDAAKDQSYVLAVLTPDQLSGALFPLGTRARRMSAPRRRRVACASPRSPIAMTSASSPTAIPRPTCAITWASARVNSSTPRRERRWAPTMRRTPSRSGSGGACA